MAKKGLYKKDEWRTRPLKRTFVQESLVIWFTGKVKIR